MSSTSGDTDDEADRFLTASVDDLSRTPAANPPDKSVKQRIDEERLSELAAARKYRRVTVRFTLWAVGLSVGAATGFMALYAVSQWHHMDASVMIAYFSSVVVQSIGILYVISKYLFPPSGPSSEGGFRTVGRLTRLFGQPVSRSIISAALSSCSNRRPHVPVYDCVGSS